MNDKLIAARIECLNCFKNELIEKMNNYRIDDNVVYIDNIEDDDRVDYTWLCFELATMDGLDEDWTVARFSRLFIDHEMKKIESIYNKTLLKVKESEKTESKIEIISDCKRYFEIKEEGFDVFVKHLF